MNIVLTGFMGAGKSEVARRLAEELGLHSIDTDDLVEREAGMPIREIFERFGETHFRRLEKNIIHHVCTNMNDIVLATGGGAVVDRDNREILKRWGTVVCLKASIDTILRRVGEGSERPLLLKGDRRETIERLLKEREPFYMEADIIIDTTGKDPGEIVEEIKALLGADPTGSSRRC